MTPARWQDPGAIDPAVRWRPYAGPIAPPKPLPHASWVDTYTRPGHKTEAELVAANVAHREKIATWKRKSKRKSKDDDVLSDEGEAA